MKNSVTIFFLLLITVSASAQSKEEQEIIQLSKRKFRWMTEMKLDSLAGILDERLLFVHSNGWAETKEEFINDIKSGKLRYQSIVPQDLVVRIYPKAAVLTGKGNFKVVLDGNDLEINLLYTEVYVRNGKKWLLASRHANRLP